MFKIIDWLVEIIVMIVFILTLILEPTKTLNHFYPVLIMIFIQLLRIKNLMEKKVDNEED